MTVAAEDTKRPFAAIANALRSSTKAARLEEERRALDVKAADDDDEDKKKKDAKANDDDQEAATAKAESDDEDTDDKKSKKKSAKENDDEDNEEKSKAKKKAADSDDEDDKDKSASAAGRHIRDGGDNRSDMDHERDPDVQFARECERGRIAAILRSDAAQVVPNQALHIALRTSLARNHAIGMLEALAIDVPPQTGNKADALRQRMADAHNPDLGVGDSGRQDTTSSDAIAAMIVAAGKKRRGES
jgi:hypothetical protein